MDAGSPCRLLEWDSEFFGRRIGRVTAERPGPADLEAVREWMRREAVDCVYWLADPDHPRSIRDAEDAGFRLVDVRVTLARSLAGGEAQAGDAGAVGPAADDEVAALIDIARSSHRNTRFYSDPNFPDARCDALYAAWIENSCAGFADRVLVARDAGAPCGYLTCHLDPDAGRIGLVAVAAGARGRGLGPRLVHGALAYFAEAGRRRAVVSTQGRNAGALQLYERAGFATESVRPWLHLWRPAA